MTCHARHSRHQKKINVKQLSKMLEDLIKNVYHVSKLERIMYLTVKALIHYTCCF